MRSVFPLRVERNQFRTFLGTIPSFLSLAVTPNIIFAILLINYYVANPINTY